MLDVIPSINCPAREHECVEKKVRLIESFAGGKEVWAHVDIADGAFTFNKSWNDPPRLHELDPKISIEVHLMVEQPEYYVEPWLKAGAKRIVLHKEVVTPAAFKKFKTLARQYNAELMLALNPETPAEAAAAYASDTNFFQALAVIPGLSGQKFLPRIIEKVKELRQAMPAAVIEVDGGINRETAKACREAGANIVISD